MFYGLAFGQGENTGEQDMQFAVISLIVFGYHTTQPVEILLPGGLPGLFGTQRGVSSGLRSQPAQEIVELDISRFLAPEGAVVVENGDPLGWWDKIG